jgi:hypothetical protein
MKKTVLMKKGSGRSRSSSQAMVPELLDDEALVDESVASGRKITDSHRRFVMLYADSGFRDPDQAALAAGFKTRGIGWKLIDRLHDLIDSERARRQMGTSMELGEALDELAKVARQDEDLKTKHAALRTVLEVHGALRDKTPIDDKKKLVREIEEIGALLKAAKTQKQLRERPEAPESDQIIEIMPDPEKELVP